LIGLAFLSGAVARSLFMVSAPESTDALRVFTLELPPTEPMALGAVPALAISSDGAGLVYTVPRGDSTELHRRHRDQLEPVRIPGTEGAQAPFFRTGRNDFGFFSKGQILRLSPNESAPFRLGDSPSTRGGSWLDDRIVFSPGTESGLWSTTSTGGSPKSVTELAPGEKSHRWPSILPDGRRALFTCWTENGFDIRVADLESGETNLVVENGSYARLAPSGHLLFVRDFTLMAAEFDETAGRIVGDPTALVEKVHFDRLTGAAFYDVSSEGTLVYAPREEEIEGEVFGRLLFLERDGTPKLISALSRGYQVPRISPTGDRLLTTITEGGSTDIWSMDLDRGTLNRVTIDGQSGVGIWHPAGNRIAYAGSREGVHNLYVKAVDSDAPEKRVTVSANTQFPTSFSPDGTRVAYVELDPDTQFDIWIWSERTGTNEPILNSPFMESGAVFSPDGRFLAYVSNETGEDEVYVVSADGSSSKTRISTSGGREPVFQSDGSVLYYRDEDSMVQVDIQTQPAFTAGEPIPLFEASFDEAGSPFANYDVTEDGSRFVMVRTDSGREAKRLIVVTHWDSTLKERVPPSR
jgi:serine/threonine-protein kinase